MIKFLGKEDPIDNLNSFDIQIKQIIFTEAEVFLNQKTLMDFFPDENKSILNSSNNSDLTNHRTTDFSSEEEINHKDNKAIVGMDDEDAISENSLIMSMRLGALFASEEKKNSNNVLYFTKETLDDIYRKLKLITQNPGKIASVANIYLKVIDLVDSFKFYQEVYLGNHFNKANEINYKFTALDNKLRRLIEALETDIATVPAENTKVLRQRANLLKNLTNLEKLISERAWLLALERKSYEEINKQVKNPMRSVGNTPLPQDKALSVESEYDHMLSVCNILEHSQYRTAKQLFLLATSQLYDTRVIYRNPEHSCFSWVREYNNNGSEARAKLDPQLLRDLQNKALGDSIVELGPHLFESQIIDDFTFIDKCRNLGDKELKNAMESDDFIVGHNLKQQKEANQKIRSKGEDLNSDCTIFYNINAISNIESKKDTSHFTQTLKDCFELLFESFKQFKTSLQSQKNEVIKNYLKNAVDNSLTADQIKYVVNTSVANFCDLEPIKYHTIYNLDALVREIINSKTLKDYTLDKKQLISILVKIRNKVIERKILDRFGARAPENSPFFRKNEDTQDWYYCKNIYKNFRTALLEKINTPSTLKILAEEEANYQYQDEPILRDNLAKKIGKINVAIEHLHDIDENETAFLSGRDGKVSVSGYLTERTDNYFKINKTKTELPVFNVALEAQLHNDIHNLRKQNPDTFMKHRDFIPKAINWITTAFVGVVTLGASLAIQFWRTGDVSLRVCETAREKHANDIENTPLSIMTTLKSRG